MHNACEQPSKEWAATNSASPDARDSAKIRLEKKRSFTFSPAARPTEKRLRRQPQARHQVSTMTDHTADTTARNFIIVGLTHEGRRFRPSDWAERLCGVMSAFGAEKRMKYSPYVGPCSSSGEKAVFVDGRLYDIEPLAYRFLRNFAADNELQLVEGCCRPAN